MSENDKNKYMKKIALLLAVVFAFGAGIWMTMSYYQDQEPIVNQQSTVLLEKIRKVCKLVTVEGQFIEHYNETNLRPISLYLPFPSTFHFAKEASIDVEGKVMVGYDMEKVSITMDNSTNTVYISNLPKPEVLAIDHNIIYRNLEESYFNSFSKEDYTQLNKNAKAALRQAAINDRLLEEAEKEGNHMLEVMKMLIEGAGWQLQIRERKKEELLN